jgi:thiamine-monophosphate kinase
VAPAALRFGPSDDYELLLAMDPAGRSDCERAAAAAGLPLAFVGRFTAAPGLLTLRAADGAARPLDGAGYDHFGAAG